MSRTRPPKAVRSILYIHWKLRYYPSNNPMNYLATNVTKKLDHNNIYHLNVNIKHTYEFEFIIYIMRSSRMVA